MTRAKFQLLTEMLAQSEHIPKGDTFGRAAIHPEKQEGVIISDRFNINVKCSEVPLSCNKSPCSLTQWPRGEIYF